ncbi:hypothetical protein [Nocardioides marmotae]|uniref:hypothetical protein n=1 Tax=Nocardioides marmotae TaxID=2663857 RepID=UPI001659F656|nr:hypothetical protein [Nocardioides marmotae]MBC9732369.1 hypothetical protein [Nocardioides marmotae]
MTSRLAAAATVTLLAATLAGCTDTAPQAAPAPSAGSPTPAPAFDVRDEAAAAAMALVPGSATSVAVTDLDRVRLQLGLPDLTGQSSPAERARFWARAATEAPLLTDGLLRGVDERLAREYGFTQDDVRWEAVFDGPDGPGYVLSFRLGLDMAAVQRAVRDRVGPLAGAEVRARDSLVVLGATDDGTRSWAADPALTALVGPPADATYVERGCVEAPSGVDTGRLEELEAWSVALQGGLATARLGELRSDAFDRMRLAASWPGERPAFADGFRRGVADPSTGRVGYELVDPVAAAALVRARTVPFAACAD